MTVENLKDLMKSHRSTVLFNTGHFAETVTVIPPNGSSFEMDCILFRMEDMDDRVDKNGRYVPKRIDCRCSMDESLDCGGIANPTKKHRVVVDGSTYFIDGRPSQRVNGTQTLQLVLITETNVQAQGYREDRR